MVYTRTTWATGNVVTPALLNNIEGALINFVNVESFRAANVTDNATITAAIAALTSGSVLRFEPGRTYTLTSALTATLTGLSNVTFDFTGSTVSAPTVSNKVITLQGAYTASQTTASSSIAARAVTVSVVSATGITAGSVIAIKSSGEVFNSDRPTQYFKAELARVESVAGTTLTLSSPTWDSYSTSGNTVTVGVVNPVTNLSVVGLNLVGGGAGQTQTGLFIQHFDGCTVRDFNVSDTEQTGVFGSLGYDFKVINARALRCNLSALGYGIKAGGVQGVTFSFIKGRKNRHSVEADTADGTPFPCRDVVYYAVDAEDDTSAGISTHGATEDVKISLSTVKDCGGGVIVRGKKTMLSHVTVLGSKSTAQSSESYIHGITLGDDNADFGQGLAGTDLIVDHCHVDISNSRWASEAINSHGLYSTSYLRNAKITNSTFKGFSSHGIYSKGDGGRDVRIFNNDVDCSAQVGTAGVTASYGIVLGPSHNVAGNNYQKIKIHDNRVAGALFSGIRVHGNLDNTSKSDDIAVDDNTITGYGSRGVDLVQGYFGTNIRASRNRFPDTSSTYANSVVWTSAQFDAFPILRDNVVGTASTHLRATVEPLWFPTYASGNYYYCNSPGSLSTSVTLGNGSLRVTPWVVTRTLSITRIAAEFTVAGDAASVFRIGIYADDGVGRPTGAAVLDAGSISTGTGNAGTVATGGTPGVYEITVSITLQPGLYWVGGAVQGVTVTQPTMRTISTTAIVVPMPAGTSLPAANGLIAGYSMSGATGALPTWSGATPQGSAVRIIFKTA